MLDIKRVQCGWRIGATRCGQISSLVVNLAKIFVSETCLSASNWFEFRVHGCCEETFKQLVLDDQYTQYFFAEASCLVCHTLYHSTSLKERPWVRLCFRALIGSLGGVIRLCALIFVMADIVFSFFFWMKYNVDPNNTSKSEKSEFVVPAENAGPCKHYCVYMTYCLVL